MDPCKEHSKRCYGIEILQGTSGIIASLRIHYAGVGYTTPPENISCFHRLRITIQTSSFKASSTSSWTPLPMIRISRRRKGDYSVVRLWSQASKRSTWRYGLQVFQGIQTRWNFFGEYMGSSKYRVWTEMIRAMMYIWPRMVFRFVKVGHYGPVWTQCTEGRLLITVNVLNAQTGHNNNILKEG